MTQRWLITGCSRGIGRALAHEVLEAGHHLVATARDPAQLSDLVSSYGNAVRVMALDVTNAHEAEAAVRAAQDCFGRLDVLVNNAGYGNVGSVEDTGLDEFRRQIETNLIGAIIVTKAAIPLMREQRSGHIIQLSSVGGRIGAPGRAPYSAAKWGVEGFSEALAREMALVGVKVTIIEPGGFRTDFSGASTSLNEGRAEYDQVVGATARLQRAYDGRQPGDPARAAQVIRQIAAMEKPPFRLPLGSDAVTIIAQADHARLDELETWRDLSVSTDFREGDRIETGEASPAQSRPGKEIISLSQVRNRSQRLAADFAVAGLVVAATGAGAVGFHRFSGIAPSASLFSCAVMLVAWSRGMGPAILATILAIMTFDYFFLEPRYTLFVQLRDTPQLIFFAIGALLVSLMCHSERTHKLALRDVRAKSRETEARVAELERERVLLVKRQAACEALPSEDVAPSVPQGKSFERENALDVRILT